MLRFRVQGIGVRGAGCIGFAGSRAVFLLGEGGRSGSKPGSRVEGLGFRGLGFRV